MWSIQYGQKELYICCTKAAIIIISLDKMIDRPNSIIAIAVAVTCDNLRGHDKYYKHFLTTKVHYIIVYSR